MNSEVKIMPEYHVASLRHIGPYEGIGEKFAELFQWAGPRGLAGGATLGVYWDDPSTVDAEKLRSDACVAVPEGTEVEGELKLQTIPGGEYLVCRTQVYNNDFKSAWDTALGEQLPASGREVTMDRPCYELFHNNAMEDPEKKWIIDICIPVQ